MHGKIQRGLYYKQFPKIKNRDVYVDYDATEDIPEDACSLTQYEDLTSLN